MTFFLPVCLTDRLIALLGECCTEENLKNNSAFQFPSQKLYQVIEFDVLSRDSFFFRSVPHELLPFSLILNPAEGRFAI